MKRQFFMAAILLLASTVFADEIHLTDNSIIKGSITEVSRDSIVYKTSEDKSASISKEKVEKIVYSNGKEITFYDTIKLKDGTELSGKVIRNSGRFIEYNPAGSIPYDRIETDKVVSIIYENGKIEEIQKAQKDYDEIYLTDGRILKGRNISIQNKYIEFNNESGIREIYGKNIIDRIVFSTGETRTFKEGNDYSPDGKDKPVYKTDTTGSFVEFELGWNGYTGSGMRFDYMFLDSFSLNGGIGLCAWGLRLSGALRYYTEYPYGFAFSLGVAYNTGGKASQKVEVEDSSGNTYNDTIDFTYKPVTTINASILYSWQVNGRDKFYIETGYSYAIQKEKYTYETESGYRLSQESKDLMDTLAPGGVILTVGYAFMF